MQKSSENHFLEKGAEYARHRPSYPPALVDFLSAQCNRHELALDVGCGNGQLARMLKAHFAKVVATDPSADQISHAPSEPGIDYRCEPAEQISLGPQCVDLIVAAQAAHWFDLERFYAETDRIARPGGIIALISYGVLDIEGAAAEVFEHFYWQDIFIHWPKERKLVENGYETLAFPFTEISMPAFQITREWNFSEFINYIKTWSAVKIAEKKGDSRTIEAFIEQLARAWGDEQTKHRVTWPVKGRVGKLVG